MMKSVFVVTEGEYSDYHICGVYSSMEKATAAQEYHNADNVQEWDLDDDACNPRGLHLWAVVMLPDRSIDYCARKPDNKDRYLTDGMKWREPDRSVRFIHWATDRKHAVKIANEKMNILIATNEWPEKVAQE